MASPLAVKELVRTESCKTKQEASLHPWNPGLSIM